MHLVMIFPDDKKQKPTESRLRVRSVLWGFVRFYRCRSCFGVGWVCGVGSVFLITDIPRFCGVKHKVADRRHKSVDSEGYNSQEHISERS